MNMSRTSFLYEIEHGEPIPIGKLAYLRERTRNTLYDFIVRKFIEAEKAGLSQAELARRIRKRPEVVNRLLGAPGNWTIDTISDLLVGIGAEELNPRSVSLLNRAPRNQTFPDWLCEIRPPSSNKIVKIEDVLAKKQIKKEIDARQPQIMLRMGNVSS
jgi:hypothetical protein